MKRILICTVALCLFIVSCDVISGGSNCIKGEGEIATRTLNLDDFTGIKLNSGDRVTIAQGNKQEVKVTGHDNILDKIRKDVNNGVWSIGLKDGCYKSYKLSVFITVPEIDQISVNGSGEVKVRDFEKQKKMVVHVNGSGDVILRGFEGAGAMSCSVNGSGSCTVDNASFKTLDVNINGSGTYEGLTATAEDCHVVVSGSGDCSLMTSGNLDVSILGSGDVLYKGTPQNLTQSIRGSGDLKQVK